MSIVFQSVSKSFGDVRVLENFSATFSEGSRTFIMGPSGCGKTTLLRLAMGLEKPSQGSVLAPKRISAVFQENRLLDPFTPRVAVEMTAAKGTSRKDIDECLTALGLGKDLSRPVKEFSGGMKRRVSVARALLAPGDALILDEPFTGLDDGTREEVAAVILRYLRGRTLLAVTHDEEDAALFDAKILHLVPFQEAD